MIAKLMASIFTPSNCERILTMLFFYRWSHFNSKQAIMQVLGWEMDAECLGFSSELDA